MKKTLLVLTCIVFSVPAFAGDNVCRDFFNTMKGRVNGVFHDRKKGFSEKKSALAGLFKEAMDVEWVSRFSAGVYWRTASEQERSDFSKAYQDYLSDHYVGAIDDEDFEEMLDFSMIDFKATESNGYAGFKVRSQVARKVNAPIEIDFSLKEDKGGCHVRDFTVEGISQIINQRDQIQSLAANGGLKHVTQRLRELSQAK
jgi:ABC-type transporter MlaC component